MSITTRSDHQREEKGEDGLEFQSSGGINSGRWTREEHAMFLKGLELHGKEWKKIADLIKTRTVVQIRTHAQKYFQKVAKHTGGPVMSTSKKEIIVKPPTRKKRGDSGGQERATTRGGSSKPETIKVPNFSRRVRSSEKETGGATPRTIAAATILLRPRIQNKLQDGGATPKTKESAAWLAAHQESAEQTLGKRRRTAAHRSTLNGYSGAMSWDAVAATASK